MQECTGPFLSSSGHETENKLQNAIDMQGGVDAEMERREDAASSVGAAEQLTDGFVDENLQEFSGKFDWGDTGKDWKGASRVPSVGGMKEIALGSDLLNYIFPQDGFGKDEEEKREEEQKERDMYLSSLEERLSRLKRGKTKNKKERNAELVVESALGEFLEREQEETLFEFYKEGCGTKREEDEIPLLQFWKQEEGIAAEEEMDVAHTTEDSQRRWTCESLYTTYLSPFWNFCASYCPSSCLP